MPQPSTPSVGTRSSPSGVGSVMPYTSSADSGTFSDKPASCSAITAFGRDTAVLKPRYTVKSKAAGSDSARAHR
jgi:hypothetical protein